MESIGDLFSELFSVWGEMFSGVWEVLPKIFFFFLWALSGLIILPAVFIAGNLYPLWSDWGEDF